MVEVTCSSEMLVDFWQAKSCYIPEDRKTKVKKKDIETVKYRGSTQLHEYN
jgi:hypothetical protein